MYPNRPPVICEFYVFAQNCFVAHIAHRNFQAPPGPGQALMTVAEKLDNLKEDFTFMQAQNHR